MKPRKAGTAGFFNMKISARIQLGVILASIVLGIAACKSAEAKKAEQHRAEELSHAKSHHNPIDSLPPVSFAWMKESNAEKRWVDSVYNNMNLTERIGQLFMVAAYSNKDSVHVNSVKKLIRDYKIGGLIFFQGGPMRQAKLTNQYQALSKLPLFIGIDAEWGLNMRLDSTFKFPFNMTLGAVRNKKLLESMGIQMAKESKRLGVHFNFAPVLDVNTNPKNPIIGFRSFGESKENVTQSALALMTGIQESGIYATGKHFPGHGDTGTDSHYALPVIPFTKERIDSLELYPYKKLFKNGLSSVMVAHLNVPAIEPQADIPSSVSKNIISDLLIDEMKFDGLIFTDALNMKAASGTRPPGKINLEALLAGNDVLLFPENIPLGIELICMAYQDGVLTEERLSKSVKKILQHKYRIGLNKYQPIAEQNLIADINPPQNKILQQQLFENAVTVVQNQNEILPIQKLENERIAYVKLGDDQNAAFLESLKNYADITEVAVTSLDSIESQFAEFSKVIVGFHKSDRAWKSQSFTDTEIQILDRLTQKKSVILDVFVRPYSLMPISFLDRFSAIVVSYQNADVAQRVSADVIFGTTAAAGRLPVSINAKYQAGMGIDTKTINRLGFSLPELQKMSSEKLKALDNIIETAIAKKTTPGAQILVARNGKVVYQKSFGKFTYDATAPKVTNAAVYDLASLTKILAPLPLLMQNYEQHKFTLDTNLGTLLPYLQTSDKKDITVKQWLSHQAGFEAWTPFYKQTLLANGTVNPTYYSKIANQTFNTRVSDSLYIIGTYRDSILQKIKNSKLVPNQGYKYSDYTFILAQKYLEDQLHASLDISAYTHFYKKIGAGTLTYNPTQRFDLHDLVPTEIDTYFRRDTIQGFVHDMAAAMQGGVGGHAGLFGNALDVAKMMQLFLQKGNYAGEQYFSSATFDTFNTRYFETLGSRRGLGFDKPQLPGNAGPTCGCVSAESFGHTGFTGTIAWADPKTQLVYVFLSNRTFPDSNAPNALSQQNVREQIQKAIQDAILE